MTETRDTAGVIAPPPLIALAAVMIGFTLDFLFPALILAQWLSLAVRLVVGGVLIAAGGALAIAGRNAFVSGGTNVNPYRPTTVLVTTGVFANLRNPMYVGLALLVTGIGIAFASDWTVVMVVPQMLVIHFGVVKREERYLEAKFGASYYSYKMRVRRYGGLSIVDLLELLSSY